MWFVKFGNFDVGEGFALMTSSEFARWANAIDKLSEWLGAAPTNCTKWYGNRVLHIYDEKQLRQMISVELISAEYETMLKALFFDDGKEKIFGDFMTTEWINNKMSFYKTFDNWGNEE